MAAQGVHKYPDGEEYKGEWMEGIEHNVLTELIDPLKAYSVISYRGCFANFFLNLKFLHLFVVLL